MAALFLIAWPAFAQTRMTVAEMQKELARLGQQREREAAPRLARFEMTERISPARLSRWELRFKGEIARQILLYLADASSIRNLPAGEIPDAPPPSELEKSAILQRAREYVRSTRPRLPNFYALRSTISFEIATLNQMKSEQYELQFLEGSGKTLGFRSLGRVDSSRQLFLEGFSDERVTYRNGSEIQTPPETQAKHRHLLPMGLTSAGEFGPILSLVDKDTAAGSIAWDRWEHGPSGLLAVYRYSVPADKSHFAFFQPSQSVPGLSYEQHPAYHGELAVDPATGSVLRIVIEAAPPKSSAPADTPVVAAIVVEYGSVEIGGKNYVCPLHAIAINRIDEETGQTRPALPRILVNDVTFTRYHLFRAEMRILP